MLDNGRVSQRRDVVVLGSTGSVGTQALDVVRHNPDRFRVVALAARGTDVGLLAEQAVEFEVDTLGVASAESATALADAVASARVRRGGRHHAVPRISAGPAAAAELAGMSADVVLNAIAGSVGLEPTLAALRAGTRLALANKESLVAGGPLVAALATPGQIVPVDSEHSALAQCLRSGRADEVRRLVLTASGGPFRGWSPAQLAAVTPAQALAHPTWSMGPVVTVNSATLMNKGLEVIEAHVLFAVPYERIDVVVHPQSVVHSMVEFVDGSTLAQAAPPDMRLPIALGLGWPDRVPEAAPSCDWTAAVSWDFAPLDEEAFPAVALARAAGTAGGVAPAVLNAANEVCVAAFLAGRLPFPAIVETVAAVLAEHARATRSPSAQDASRVAGGNRLAVAEVVEAEQWARARATVMAGLDVFDRQETTT